MSGERRGPGPAGLALIIALASAVASAAPPIDTVVIDRAAGPLTTLNAQAALGAAIDGMDRGAVTQAFTPYNIARMTAAGFGPVTYRLRTELAIEAWHWGEEGTWSDPGGHQGYWTSSDNPRRPVVLSWGYRLPRRGTTVDQAAGDGFSRLDDGDPATFWKSNPYLDPAFTGQATTRPQWVVAAFPADVAIDTARIRWAAPFARRFEVQYWAGADEYDDEGRWVAFPNGIVSDGRGGDQTIRLAPAPVSARFVRLLLQDSSRTAPAGARDRRDSMGFAIGEVSFGVTDPARRFADAVRHSRSAKTQTLFYVSSTDPWHRARDRDLGLEQPGFDRMFQSGLTRGLPVMIPVGALYDTPANAAAEIRFLKRRGYAFDQVEVGEEPDGQNIDAEDFAALYIQFADAVHAVDPRLKTGGPSLQQAVSDTWLNQDKDHSWTRHFTAALAARGRLNDLGFFSFERYPVEDLCGPEEEKLRDETAALPAEMARLRSDNVPAAIPWVISEYGYSAYGARAEVEMTGALMNADIAANFLTRGGQGAYFFGYPPSRPYGGTAHACAGEGNLMLFEADARGQARSPLPAFFGARLLTQDWAGPGEISLYRAAYQPADPAGRPWVSAYAARRADGHWSVLLINRDPGAAWPVTLALGDSPGGAGDPLVGPLEVVQYGADAFDWPAPADTGQPRRDQPPRRFRLASAADAVTLPASSITVVSVATPAVNLQKPK